MKLLQRLVSACALVFAAACAPAPQDAASTAPSSSLVPAIPAGAPSFLALVPQAHLTTRLMGVRRAEFDWPTATGSTRVVQLERVAADGAGRFLIDPLSVLEPALTPDQRDLHALLQKNREGFYYNWRDFRIRDLQLFFQNWELVVVGEETVAGRIGTVLTLRRQGVATPLRYRAVIDPPTGLVLAHEEYDELGKTVSRMRWEDLQINPALPELAWHADRFPADELQDGAAGTTQLGVRPSAPQTLPPGYRLSKSEVFAAGGKHWLRRIYTDGVDALFFLQSPRPVAPGHQQVDVDGIGHEGAAHRALMYRAGPWVACDFGRELDKVMVVGRLDDQGLLHLLRSVR